MVLVPLAAAMQSSKMAGRKLIQSIATERLFGLPSQDSEIIAVERPIVATLKAVESCLSAGQVRLLVQMNWEQGNKNQPKIGLFGRLSRWCRPWRQKEATDALSMGSVTGVASDLETRSLVLVLGHQVVWNGLSAEQQVELQTQILRFLEGEEYRFFGRGAATFVLEQNAALVNQTTGLIHDVHSFWIVVLRAVADLKRRYRMGSVPELEGGTSRIAGTSKPSNMLPFVSPPSLPLADPLNVLSAGRERLQEESCWEAKATTIGYIEHPLERLLKWVDRLLVWVEAQWQRWNDWRSHLNHSKQ